MKEAVSRKKTEKEKGSGRRRGLHLFGTVVFVYVVLFVFYPQKIRQAVKISANVLLQILPALLLIIVFMGAINYFLNPKAISRYVGKGSGVKGWLLAVVAGILSHGPIYAWYPVLRDLRNQGMTNGLIAVFLYNRAIKLPLLPLMIHYFGTAFVVILIAYIVVASIFQGWAVQMLQASRPNET